MQALAREAWKAHGTTPAQLFALTPLELLAVFGKAVDEGGEFDRVAELARTNHRRAGQGRPPSAPAWLMKEVPRWGRRTP